MLFMTIRSFAPESFLQEEWMHAQPLIYNQLDQADYMDWNLP
jgi:hypothetical protein